MRDACRLIRGRDCPAEAVARSSVAGIANAHKAANPADAAGTINQLSRRAAFPNGIASFNVVEQRAFGAP
jgi:hypothetical protein